MRVIGESRTGVCGGGQTPCSNSTPTHQRTACSMPHILHVGSTAAISSLLPRHSAVLPGACTCSAAVSTESMLCGIRCRQTQCSNSTVSQQRNCRALTASHRIRRCFSALCCCVTALRFPTRVALGSSFRCIDDAWHQLSSILVSTLHDK